MNADIHNPDAEKRKHPRLPWALAIAVVLTLAMTTLSVSVYYMAGFYKFDLSRPGYESERQNVANDDTPRTYDTTTPVNSAAVDTFLSEYDVNVDAMRVYGDFDDSTVLSDESLFLTEQ